MKSYNDLIKTRIKTMRIKHELTEEQISEKLGWDLVEYVNLEKEMAKGGTEVYVDYIKVLCDFYKMDSADYFLPVTSIRKQNKGFDEK